MLSCSSNSIAIGLLMRAANEAVKDEVRVLVVPCYLSECIDALRKSASQTRSGDIKSLDVTVLPPQKPVVCAVRGGVVASDLAFQVNGSGLRIDRPRGIERDDGAARPPKKGVNYGICVLIMPRDLPPKIDGSWSRAS